MRIRLNWLVVIVIVLTASLVFGQNSENADPRALEQFIKGTGAAQQGNPYQAIYYFEEAIRYDPQAPFLHVALAEQYLVLAQENQSAEAIVRAEKSLERALELDDSHAPALELQSRLFSAQGKMSDAKRVVRKLLSRYPANRGYQIELLGLCLTSGEFDVVDSLYRVIQTGDDHELTRRVVAIYLMTGEGVRAIPYMEELAQADTMDAAVAYTLATLYLQSNDTVRAVQGVDRAIQLDSTDGRFWYLKLVIEFDHERYERVLELAELARTSADEDSRAANLEGLCYMRLADTTRALERFTRALELDSVLYPAAGSLALIYDALGDMEKSEEYYDIAIDLSDSAAIYLNNLAYMYAVRGVQLERAMKLVDIALEKDPENSSYLDTKGWIFFQQGNHSAALKWIKKALKLDKNSAPLLEHLGDIYFAMDKPSRAHSYWSQAHELDPNSVALREKLGK